MVFDPGWRVVVWNRRAQDLFGLTEDGAVGRALEDTGILPDPGYGPVLRSRLEAGEEVMLAGAPVPDAGDRGRTMLHRFRRITTARETLGFLCASSFHGEMELAGGSPAALAMRPGPSPSGLLLEDLENSLQAIADHAELFLRGVAATPAAGQAGEILRAVEDLHRRIGGLHRHAGAGGSQGPGPAMGGAGEDFPPGGARGRLHRARR